MPRDSLDLMDDPDESELDMVLSKLTDKPRWLSTNQRFDCAGVKICTRSPNGSM